MKLVIIESQNFVGQPIYAGIIGDELVFPASDRFHSLFAAKRGLVEIAIARGINATVDDVIVKQSPTMG